MLRFHPVILNKFTEMKIVLIFLLFPASWTGKCVYDQWDRTLPTQLMSNVPSLTPAKCLQARVLHSHWSRSNEALLSLVKL